jgi:uncharacterized protein YndB with AHSA1/START domain
MSKAAGTGIPDHVLTIDIMVPVQAVWDEITRTGGVQRPLMNTVLETDLQPGAKLRYYSPDKKRVFVVGEVLEVSPPHVFCHTYVFTTEYEPPTVVRWELQEIPGGCRVTLTHGGWTDQHKAPDKTRAGWQGILEVLKAELETGDIPFKTKLMYAVMGRMMFILPRSTKVEEVDRAGW